MPKNLKYTKELINFLAENVKGTSFKELTELVNRTFNSNYTETEIHNACRRNHLTNGLISGRFEKGHNAWNKGRKMPQETYEKCSKTWFKKGNKTWHEQPLYSERVAKKDGYIYIKYKLHAWKPKQRYVYEKAHNVKLEKSDVIIFLDGNKYNFDIDNLFLCSQREMRLLNSCTVGVQTPEMRKCAILRFRLEEKLKKIKKEGGNNKINKK